MSAEPFDPTATAVHEACEQIEISVEAAAILLTLAMRETDAPVAELGGALGRIANAIAAPTGDGRRVVLVNGASPDVAPAQLRAAIADDLAICVRGLQFHDRLIQQLAAVRNYLASLAHHAPLDTSGFGAMRWDELLQMLRERLVTDSQHELFDVLLRTGVVDLDGHQNDERPEGSVELF